jgi:hypothetical protein
MNKITKEEVLDKLRRIGPQPIVPCVPATVVSVEGFTCTVKFPDDFELPGVRLKAGVDDSKEYFLIVPRVDSTVLLSTLGRNDSDGEYYVVGVNEVDSLEYIIDKTSLKMEKGNINIKSKDSGIIVKDSIITIKNGGSRVYIFEEEVVIESAKKIAIRNNAENLNSLLKEIVGFFSEVKVLTGSPGSLSPISPLLAADIAAIKTKIDKLLKP